MRIGTIYRNVGKTGVWSSYSVSQFVENSIFELSAADQNYHVKYILTPLSETSCELEYFEWMQMGELDAPFTQDVLEKLKLELEK